MRRIVYLSWPAGEITGGVKAIFQHVELLRESGREALVATDDGKAPTWFETQVPVCSLNDITRDDVLVFPENNPALFERFASSAQPKLVFCQNPYQVWRGMGGRDCYADWGVSHVLCVSRTVLEFCALRTPRLKLAYAPYFVDDTRFSLPATKQLQVLCAPRKRQVEAMAIHDLVRATHPELGAWQWVFAEQVTEDVMARAMQEAAVFLSLARLEAHSMTTLEAMASGCVVAGFQGNACGSDSATASNGFWCAEDDIEGCARQLARAMALVSEGGASYQLMVARARQTALTYSRAESGRFVLQAWESVLADIAVTHL